MAGRIEGRRVLISRAQEFMGPAIAELFREKHNIHINLMAQFLVENPTSVPGGKLADLALRLPEVPAGRKAKGRESALLALYLASAESDFLVGQVIPFAGGWA